MGGDHFSTADFYKIPKSFVAILQVCTLIPGSYQIYVFQSVEFVSERAVTTYGALKIMSCILGISIQVHMEKRALRRATKRVYKNDPYVKPNTKGLSGIEVES